MGHYIIQNIWTGRVFTCPAREAQMWAILNQQMDQEAFNIFRVGGSMVHLTWIEIK